MTSRLVARRHLCQMVATTASDIFGAADGLIIVCSERLVELAVNLAVRNWYRACPSTNNVFKLPFIPFE